MASCDSTTGGLGLRGRLLTRRPSAAHPRPACTVLRARHLSVDGALGDERVGEDGARRVVSSSRKSDLFLSKKITPKAYLITHSGSVAERKQRDCP